MSNERRRFFRVDDVVNLKYEIIDKSSVEVEKKSFWEKNSEWQKRNLFNRKIEEHLSDFKIIQRDMPEVARYISMLQDQINLLNLKLVDSDNWPQGIRKAVSLSAQGIAFYAEHALETDDMIDLTIQLLPEGQTIAVIARVVSCLVSTSPEDGQYYLSMDFDQIYDLDQDIMVKHINGLQIRTLGANRNEDD